MPSIKMLVMGVGRAWAHLMVIVLFILADNPAWSRIDKINYRQKEKQVLDSILGQGYDKRIRPSGRNETVWSSMGNSATATVDDSMYDGPTTVHVNTMIRSISKIDDYKMEYSVQVTFREQWNDERLRYYDETKGHLKYLTLTDPTKVWMPDTFFRNEKEARKHEIIVPNVYIRIFPDGEILYSIRISLTLACPMDLRLYPLDKQVCVLQIASYGWAMDDLIYQWKEKDPVQVVPGLHLPRFSLEQYKSAYCDVTTNTGKYSCLKVELIFKREFSYYLITIYVPCCMLVIVSWVSFWLDQNAIPARVSLGVTTLLTMSTQTSGINAQLPPVSYTKAIDVWTGVCQCFVFCALLEFALVNYASRSDMQRDRARERMERARRQWELEHADQSIQQQAGMGGTGTTNTLSSGPTAAAATANNGKMNHIGAASQQQQQQQQGVETSVMDGGIPGFALKKRASSSAATTAGGGAVGGFRSPYPHPSAISSAASINNDLAALGFSGLQQDTVMSSFVLPPDFTTGPAAATAAQAAAVNSIQTSSAAGGMGPPPLPPIGRSCEVHMNTFNPPGIGVPGPMPSSGPGHSVVPGLDLQSGCDLLEHTCTWLLCCGTRGLLSKFPSRAKRIDVISRFIFPLIFAIFNLAYWLYYLFAKSRSPQLEG